MTSYDVIEVSEIFAEALIPEHFQNKEQNDKL